MVLLVIERLCHSLKLSSKLENHHHQPSDDALSASLQAFQSDISNSLNQLSSNLEPGSEFLSLLWIHQCLELLPNINQAFAKLVVDINYPIRNWDGPSIEEYLKYSLKLLDLLNSISSSLSHLGQAQLSLSHALSLVQSSPPSAIERLKANQFKNLRIHLKLGETEKSDQESPCSGKEWIVHQALIVVKSIGYWVCGIVLSGLSGDSKPYLEMKKARTSGFFASLLIALDSIFCEASMEKKGIVKEMREVDNEIDCLVAAIEAGKSSGHGEQLEGKLGKMRRLLDDIGKEVDGIFSEILAARNESIDSLRQRIQ